MKVKLLKKVRERYSITHYPNGVYIYGGFFKGPITMLIDGENKYRWHTSKMVKEEAYEKLYKLLLIWIEDDYGPSKSKTKIITSEELWYKK